MKWNSAHYISCHNPLCKFMSWVNSIVIQSWLQCEDIDILTVLSGKGSLNFARRRIVPKRYLSPNPIKGTRYTFVKKVAWCNGLPLSDKLSIENCPLSKTLHWEISVNSCLSTACQSVHTFEVASYSKCILWWERNSSCLPPSLIIRDDLL